MRLRIASRRSDLARLQAQMVGSALMKAERGLQIDFHYRESLGDLNQNDPLWKMPERGVFTEDFREGLASGDWDLVVHSWKDLPVEDRPETEIIATLPRADMRDLLLVRRDVFARFRAGDSPGPLRILSSSPRRQYNFEACLPKLLPFPQARFQFLTVRGNVPTRFEKLLRGDGDALVMAKAALDRLLSAEAEEFRATRESLRSMLNEVYWMVMPLSLNPAAAAQGALAVEVRRGREDLRDLLHAIHCAHTFSDVAREREILARHGGGCHQKIGATIFRTELGRVLSLRGVREDGEVLNEFRALDLQNIPKASGQDSYFPRPTELAAFFVRQPIENLPSQPEGPILVAKAEALPQEWSLAPTTICWTAGVTTWERLAERGVWVHGTFDGVGEGNPGIDELMGNGANFTKLTHTRGEKGTSARVIGTYELQEKSEVPDLQERTHFFWMSGSQFDVALRRFPSIREGVHASGPGHTHRHLRKRLGEGAKIYQYLSLEDWKKEILPK